MSKIWILDNNLQTSVSEFGADEGYMSACTRWGGLNHHLVLGLSQPRLK